jgi:hypothetical protein
MMQNNAIPALCSAISRPRNRHLNFREAPGYAQVLGHNWKTRNGPVENPHFGRAEGYFNVTTGGKLSDKAATMERKIMKGGYWYVQAARIAGLPEDIVEALQLNGVGTIAARNGNEWVFNQSTPDAANLLTRLSILHSGNFTKDTMKALKALEESSGRSPGSSRVSQGLISIQGIAAYSFKPVEANSTGTGGVRQKKLSKNIIDRLTVFYNCVPSIRDASDYITLDGRKSKSQTARNNKWHSTQLGLYADTQDELAQFAQFVINNRTQIRSIDHETYFPRTGIDLVGPEQPDKKRQTKRQALANASMFSNQLRQEAAVGQFQVAQSQNQNQVNHFQQPTHNMNAYAQQINTGNNAPNAFSNQYSTSQNVFGQTLQLNNTQQLSLSPSNLLNNQSSFVPNQQEEIRERPDSRNLASYGQAGNLEDRSVQVHSVTDTNLANQLIGGNSAINSPRTRLSLGQTLSPRSQQQLSSQSQSMPNLNNQFASSTGSQ